MDIEGALGIGLDSHRIGPAQMALRAALVYVLALVVVRLAHKRFMARATAFDMILAIVLGAVLSRAITGQAAISSAAAAALVLVLAHGAFAVAAFHFHSFGNLVKGRARELVRDGVVRRDALRREALSDHDLAEALRAAGHGEEPDGVRLAVLERSGAISVIPVTSRAPRILEVRTESGVQTIRIELS